MGDRPAPLPGCLSFAHREDEAVAYNDTVWRRLDRGPGDINFYGLLILLVFAIGSVVLLVAWLGLLSPQQIGPVFFTAYVGFFAGAFIYHLVVRLRYRAVLRALFQKTIATGPFDVSFDERGVVHGTGRSEIQIPWASIDDVIETSLLIILMFEPSQGVSIPTRLFPDAEAHKAFAAVIRQYASSARMAPALGS